MLASSALLLLFLPTVQDPTGNARIQREADFARALTIELGMEDLAETVLERAMKGARGDDQSVLLLARCDIRKATAKRSRPEHRLDALASAGHAYADFLGSSPPINMATTAQVALGELAVQFGMALGDEIDDGSLTKEELNSRSKEAESIFMAAKDGLDEIIMNWETMSDGDEKDALRFSAYFPSQFFKSQVYFFWAKAYPATSIERMDRSSKALEMFENFALLVGESSRAGLMAYKHMADTYALQAESYAARGEPDESAYTFEESEAFYEHIIENGVPEGVEMSAGEVHGRQVVQQDAHLGLMKMYTSWGRPAQATQLGESFQTWVDDEGIILGPPGYRALLFIASNYVLDGRYEDAITLAESVTLDNQDSSLRLDADAVLADAIAAAPPGADIDLAVLYSAAEGTYYTKDFAKARDGFLLLLQRLPTSRQADEFGARAFYFLGRSYSYLDSPLEAAVTHQQGYELYPDDETHTSKNASSWMKAAERFRSAAPDDLVLDQFWKDAVDAVSSTSAGGAPDQAKWTAAQSDYSRAKDKAKEARGKEGSSAEGKAAILALDKAISGYKGIESGSRYYEQAAVQVGMCLFRKMDWDSAAGDQAFQAFDDYLTIFVQNPENNPQDARGRKMRSDSVAQADFYRGQVRYKQAQSGQASAWTEVLSLYDGFSERHESQRDYTAAAWVANIQAHLAGQNFEAATAQFDELNSSGFSDARVAQAAHYLFSFWENFGDTQSGQAKTDALSNAADYLSIANNRAKKQNWQNLLKEARLRMDIQQPANAATLLEKVLSQFENDSSFTERNQFFARMDLVDSYLAQFNTAQADPIIKELLVTRPNNLRVIQASVRVLCGWPTLKDGTVVEVPGVGTPEAHEQANTLLSTLTQLAAKEAEDSGVSKFEHAPYWEARAQMAYLLYQQSLVNSAFKGKHKTLVDSLQRLAPDLGEAAAGPDLRTILLWIQSR